MNHFVIVFSMLSDECKAHWASCCFNYFILYSIKLVRKRISDMQTFFLEVKTSARNFDFLI